MNARMLKFKAGLAVAPWTLALVYAGVAFMGRNSFALTTFGNVAQIALALLLVLSFAVNAVLSEERARWFWYLMAVGSFFWLASQGVWTYYELWKEVPPPEPGLGGVLLFLHLIPMTAALAVGPHKRSSLPPLSALSIGMVFTWWLFLYAFLVVPWQYVNAAPKLYADAFNSLYAIEDVAFMGLLALWAVRAKGNWRSLYLRLLMGSAFYTLGSVFLERRIAEKSYYTGNLWDLLFIVPIAWLSWVSASFKPEKALTSSERKKRTDDRVGWITLAALLSVPCLLLWNSFSLMPESVRSFRSVAGLCAIVLLALLLFAKQYVLAGRLAESLKVSETNVAELTRLREQLEEKATHDGMTGLLNRGTVLMSLEHELARASRENKRVAALLLDLDHFKAINDNHGHHAGDTAIAFAATCMEQSVRAQDYVGRYGGEEFLVVISDCDELLARDIAERIRLRLQAEKVSFDGSALVITATLGLALSSPEETAEGLLRRADAALYVGKQRGRNTVVCAPEIVRSRTGMLA